MPGERAHTGNKKEEKERTARIEKLSLIVYCIVHSILVLPYTVRSTQGRQAVTIGGCADAGTLLSSFLARRVTFGWLPLTSSGRCKNQMAAGCLQSGLLTLGWLPL